MRSLFWIVSVAVVIGFPSLASAQAHPSPSLDLSAGWAGFADESVIHHRTATVSARFYGTPRFSIGPELTYMVGPGTDRDLYILGNVTYEWPVLERDGFPRILPFVIGGWGYSRHRSRFGSFIAHTTAYAGGTGVRVRVLDRVFAGAELRFGSELQMRVNGTVTVMFKRERANQGAEPRP